MGDIAHLFNLFPRSPVSALDDGTSTTDSASEPGSNLGKTTDPNGCCQNSAHVCAVTRTQAIGSIEPLTPDENSLLNKPVRGLITLDKPRLDSIRKSAHAARRRLVNLACTMSTSSSRSNVSRRSNPNLNICEESSESSGDKLETTRSTPVTRPEPQNKGLTTPTPTLNSMGYAGPSYKTSPSPSEVPQPNFGDKTG